MAGLTKNKLCCTLNTFHRNKSKSYCKPCFRGAVEKDLLKRVDWDKVPYWIAEAMAEFIDDRHGCDVVMEYMGRCHEDDLENPFEETLETVIGKDYSEHGFDDIITEAWEVRDDLMSKAHQRVKIVVE